MAPASRRDVVVRFLGDTGNLGKGLDGLKGRFIGVTGSLQGIAQLGAVVGGISFFKTAIGEAREAERVTRKTQAVLKSTGGQANVTADQVSGLSESMSELAGVDDEVIQQGANVLLTFTKVRNEVGQGNDVFDQAAKVSLDMAAALDKTGDSGAAMQENAIRIGKALNDPVRGMTALTKVGVSFTQQQKDQVAALVESGDVLGAQKIILSELQTEFGGMAEASADATDKAVVGWANFAENVGMRVMPAVTALSNWALHTGLPALGRVAETVGDVVEPAFRGLVSAGREAVQFWQGLPAPIQTAAIAMGAWMLVGDRVEGFFRRGSGPVRTFGEDVRVAMGAFDVNRFTGTFMALEERVPVVGQMGNAFRTARGDTEGFGGALRGVASGAMVGFKAAGSGLVSFLGGPWGLAVAGAAAVLSIWIGRQNAAKQAAAAHEARIKSLTQEIVDNGGAVSKQTKLQHIQEAESKRLFQVADKLGISQNTMTQAVLGNADAIAEVNRAFDKYGVGASEFTGSSEEVLRVFDGFAGFSGNDQWGSLVGALGDARRGFGGLSGEMLAAQGIADSSVAKLDAVESETKAVGMAQQSGKNSTDLYKTAIESAGIEFDESAGMADQLRQAIEALTQAEVSQMDTLEGYEASMDALDTAIQDNGATLDIHTEKGRANRDALEEVAMKSRALMQADIDAGVPANEALARHDARIATLKQEATAVFGANSEALGLIETYGKVPKQVRTAIVTEGYEAVHAKMRDLGAIQFLLSEGMPLTPANIRAVNNETRYQFAGGGYVSGPGGPRDDKIPALLSDGEFVQQAAAVQYYGPGFMRALNERRVSREAVPAFAGGGLVVPIKVNLSKTKIPDPAVLPGGASIAALQNFALQQKGKRYQWGATGPNTWDCSGLVGAIWALAHGKNPYRRYMTTAGMGVGKHGMKAGRGPVTVYLGPGHTAANIGGLHAEAYGGNGVPLAIGRVGTPLSFYNQVMHLRDGGLASLKNDPAARARSFALNGWPEPTRIGGYKNGGWLNPGELAYNETRKPEAIFNEDQFRAMAKPKVEKHYHLTTITQSHQIDVPLQFARMELMEGL